MEPEVRFHCNSVFDKCPNVQKSQNIQTFWHLNPTTEHYNRFVETNSFKVLCPNWLQNRASNINYIFRMIIYTVHTFWTGVCGNRIVFECGKETPSIHLITHICSRATKIQSWNYLARLQIVYYKIPFFFFRYRYGQHTNQQNALRLTYSSLVWFRRQARLCFS